MRFLMMLALINFDILSTLMVVGVIARVADCFKDENR